MEAARTLAHPLAELRERRFERECEALRPLGIAYIRGRFGDTLDHAEAEDAVSEVVIRLHRAAAASRAPDNLRAAFFTSCRNAAIDHLRSRNARPTVPLEAVAEAPTDASTPSELAEVAEDGARLREAMARMRPNYREAIALRFGLGLTVPEIASRMEISLPAAKKLVLRSTNQIRDRLEAISGERFCPEIRAAAERSLFSDSPGEEDANDVALRAHLEHCGACRGHLARLRESLHELGSAGVLATYLFRTDGRHLATLADRLNAAAHFGLEKLRLLAFRSAGSFRADGPGAGSALLSSGQKLAAVCTAGAATATCVATGLVGPGIGAAALSHHSGSPPVHHNVARIQHTQPPAARPEPKLSATASSEPMSSAPTETHTTSAGTKPAPSESQARAKKSSHSEPAASPSERSQEEFGIESEPEPAPEASAGYESSARVSSAAQPPAPETSSGSSSAGSSSGGGTEKFGFGG